METAIASGSVSCRCTECHGQLAGSYVTALNREWHARCFKCAACRQPIHEHSFAVEGGQPYHTQCHQTRFGIRCYACGGYIEGRYHTHHWGAFCARHQSEAKCVSCSKVISAEGGVRLSDGRTFCASCQRTAVTGETQAKVHQHIARSFMGQLGFALGADISLELRGKNHPDFSGKCLGLTKTVTRSDGSGREIGRQISSIAVLSHLPALEFEAVLIHEYYHVWEHLQGLSSSRLTSEGIAELCSWRYLESRHGDELAVVLKQGIEQRSDDVYGEGFRLARRAMERYGFAGLVRRVAEGGML